MKILLTGGAGYIGSILTTRLLDAGYQVDVLDSLIFGGQSIISNIYNPDFRLIQGSIASINKKIIRNVDVVLHLAAIAFTQGETMADEISYINYESTKNIVDLCKEFHKPLIFNSTCSNYGECKYATEDTELNPTNAYARSKTNAEKYIINNYPTATIFRLSTVFGLSPRMRFDTTINEFTLYAHTLGHIRVYNYDAWRPYIHIDDVANTYLYFLNDLKNLRGIYNIGDNLLNYSKRNVCDTLKRFYPNLNVELIKEINEPRDYKVSFDKLNATGFHTVRTLEEGITEIKMALENKVYPCTSDLIYNNFKWYQQYYG